MSSPLTESTYGSPPYHESALKSALRVLASGGAFGAGLGAVRPGSNFGEAFLSSMGASSKAYSAAKQAAEAYSMKQQEAQQKQEADVLRQEFLKAEIEKMKRPEKPEKPTKDAEAQRILGRPLTETEKLKLAGVYIAPPKAGAGPKAPKPAKPPETRIPASLKKTEGDLLREIGWTPKTPEEAKAMPGFIQHLTDIMTGRAGYDSPDLRRAAQMRLNDIQRQAR